MDRSIYTYALIKSLYDQGEDYIDSFWPFAIKAFPADRFLDSVSIQRNLKKKFDLEMPLHVLGTILNRAKRRRYVKQKEKRYKLTGKGLEYRDTLETDKEVARRINALLEDMTQFFNERNEPLSRDEIGDLLVSFLHANIEPLIEFINPSAPLRELAIRKLEAHGNLVIEYVQLAGQQKPENYRTLQEMFLGSVISAILYAKEPSDMTEIRIRKFQPSQVFLDTNFVFFILGLHTPEFNVPAKELLRLLKNRGFDLKVFSFTVDEICRVVNGYLTQAHRYPITIAVDTLYSSLKRHGWTRTRAREFIANIEGIFQENRIEIVWAPDIDLKNYTPPHEELRNLIANYKPSQDLFHQNHDLAAIEIIKEIRTKPVRTIEDSKVFFLTADARLSKFDFIEMGHKENGTICEVILDRLLTNILWLKDPSAEPPLESIIAAYSRDLFIKRRIWDRFYEVLRRLKQEGKVGDENISTLFYHGYIEDALRGFDDWEADKITGEFVLAKIEEAAKFREEILEQRIREKEEQFLQQLKEAVSLKEQQKEAEWLERIQKIKTSLRESAHRKASRDSTLYASVLTLLALGIIYLIYLVCKKVGLVEFLTLLLPLILGGGGILALWTRFRTWLERRLFNRIYIQKLREAKLDEQKTE